MTQLISSILKTNHVISMRNWSEAELLKSVAGRHKLVILEKQIDNKALN